MWNAHKPTPWLLRFFDQIRFYPVSAEELLEYREAFPHGGFQVRTEDTTFRLSDQQPDATDFKRRQQAAFEEERERWAATGQNEFNSEPPAVEISAGDDAVPDGCSPVRSPITASVWSVAVQPGERVEAGQRLLVLEAMKMEVAVAAPQAGVVHELRCSPGGIVNAGQHLLLIRSEAAL
jgi:urea carboxylase